MSEITILIAARNADKTIERAVRSVASNGHHPIILIDDFSSDQTVSKAVKSYAGALKVIQPPERKNVSTVRSAGLKSVTTKFAMWLDADDEFLPGRVDAMMDVLRKQKVDFGFGNCQLIDSTSDTIIKELKTPSFLLHQNICFRQFERNWIPSIGWPIFNTEAARRLDYDTDLMHGEDYDILLRAIREGYKVGFTNNCAHKYFDYPTSLSRNLDRSRDYLPQILAKHDYSKIIDIMESNNVALEDQILSLMSVTLFKKDYDAAYEFIEKFKEIEFEDAIEPAYGRSKSWLFNFYRGVVSVLTKESAKAVEFFSQNLTGEFSPELENNLAVALFQIGQDELAKTKLRGLVKSNPNYVDAVLNNEMSIPMRITTHPFRLENSRDNYLE